MDNVPGAGGAIGADKVAKAPADGYTLLMGHIGTLAVNPSLYPRLPYRGTAPAMTDLMGGQIQLLFTGAPAVIGQIKNSQLRALAVSSPQRLDALPDVPTVAESGYKGFEADQWYGVVAPAGTPREIVAKLNAQINQALNAPRAQVTADSRRRRCHAEHARGVWQADQDGNCALEAGDWVGPGAGGLSY